jgi:hypothetical protein
MLDILWTVSGHNLVLFRPTTVVLLIYLDLRDIELRDSRYSNPMAPRRASKGYEE